MNSNREITVKILIPDTQEGPLAATLESLKLSEEQFVQALVWYGLRKAEEGVFDGSLEAGDALEMNSGFGRQLRDRIGRMVQVLEKALVEQQAVIAAFRQRILKQSNSSRGGKANG